MTDRNRPLYRIGVVAEMLEVHPQTLRFYEKKGRRMVDMQRQIQDLLAYVRETGGDVESVAGRESRESLVKAAAGQLQPVDLF